MLYLGDVIYSVRLMMNVPTDIRRNANSIRFFDADLARMVDEAKQEYIRLNPRDYIYDDDYVFEKAAPKTVLDPSVYLKVIAPDTKQASYPEWRAGIRQVERNAIDSFYAAWPTALTPPVDPATYVPQFYALDPMDPLAFWLYPCPAVGSTIRLKLVYVPDDFQYTDQFTIDLDQTLDVPYYAKSAIVDYVLHRLCRLESDGAANDDAEFYYDQFRRRALGDYETAKQMNEGQRVPPEAE